MSFNSSITRDHAWSELSKGLSELTLANLSIISVIALPVKASELTNSSWYQVNITTAVRTLQLQTPTSSRKQAFVEEIHGQRVRQLEEEVTKTIRMIQDKRPVEVEEAKAMHLKQTSEIIGRALATFSSNVREDPTSVLSSDLSRSIFELRESPILGHEKPLAPTDLLKHECPQELQKHERHEILVILFEKQVRIGG